MRNGGNRRLKELLDVYGINPKKVKSEAIYSSKLLDFYRKLLKSEIFKDKQPTPPSKETAMSPLNDFTENTKKVIIEPEKSKYTSVSSDNNDENSKNEIPKEGDAGFLGHLNSWMNKAYTTTTGLATSFKDKITETNFGSSIVDVGSSSMQFITGTGEAVFAKSTEVAV